jgi:metal-sulfur cluster biosynthetic enzyme
VASVEDAKRDVLIALSQIIDPDFGTDIVSCGFIKDLEISEALEEVRGHKSDAIQINCHFLDLPISWIVLQVSFRVELTTPACPVKDMVSAVLVFSYIFRIIHSLIMILLHNQHLYQLSSSSDAWLGRHVFELCSLKSTCVYV